MKNGQRPARKMDLNHLHLHVRNVDRSTRFYESYFGFRERVRHGNILFLRNASGFDLALVPDRTPLSFPEWFHFGFRLGSARAVRMLHGHMISKGGQVQDIEEYPGYMTFRCADPDGYGIEVYWE
jgi:catechol 2,3-dioxygenase-like lactoylglutathione lyase family enzyme